MSFLNKNASFVRNRAAILTFVLNAKKNMVRDYVKLGNGFSKRLSSKLSQRNKGTI